MRNQLARVFLTLLAIIPAAACDDEPLSPAHAGAPSEVETAAADEQASIGGAPHTAEAKYVFDDGVDGALADPICDYWVSFAKTGDPNHDSAPDWPTAEDDALIEFTGFGPVTEQPDPWGARLDAVRVATERPS